MATNHRDLGADSNQPAYQLLEGEAVKTKSKKSKKSKAKAKNPVVIENPAVVIQKATATQPSTITPIEELTDESTVSCCFGFFQRKKPAPPVAKPAPTEPSINQLLAQNLGKKL